MITSLLVACSSPGTRSGSGAAGGSGDPGGSSGRGDAGGSGGSGDIIAGSSGGVGGSQVVDAGPADATSAGSGGSGVATTSDQVCRAAVGALCDRVSTCSGFAAGAPCDDIAAVCPDYLFNATSTRTVAAISDCLADLKAQPCTDLGLGVRPACLSRGTLPAGAACAHASNCQSGDCSPSNTVCGSCSSNATASGASCADGSLCPPGDFCHPGTKLCTSGSTIVHAGVGQPCDLAAVPSVGCSGDLRCVTPDAGTAGTCTPPTPPIVVGGDQACDTTHVCGPGLICFTDIVITGDASTSTSTCVPEYPCGGEACDATTFCKVADGGYHCLPKAAAGDGCLGDAGRMTTTCMNGLYCSTATGACTAYGKQGDPCDGRSPCAAYFLCASGRCVPLSSQSCSTANQDAGVD